MLQYVNTIALFPLPPQDSFLDDTSAVSLWFALLWYISDSAIFHEDWLPSSKVVESFCPRSRSLWSSMNQIVSWTCCTSGSYVFELCWWHCNAGLFLSCPEDRIVSKYKLISRGWFSVTGVILPVWLKEIGVKVFQILFLFWKF